ncbi:MAG: glycosyltransferase, partial [Pseudomonadales bacterium]|nr:glycosyltransferase [Pseudomonadales bacterium]
GAAPFDVVFASSGPYTTLRVADGITRTGAAKRFVAEFRDLWTANHSARGVFPFTVRERSIERGILSRVDRVVTVSDALAGWLRGQTPAPVDVVYNGHAGRRTPIARSEGDAFTIAYTGAVYERGHDLGPFMRALALIRGSDRALYERVRVVVAGGSGDAFASAARCAGVLDRVELLGEVSHDRSIEIQNRADALLSLEWTGPEGGVLTGKVFEYLACEAPILVVGPRREISELVVRCGRGVHAGDAPGAIAEALTAAASGAMVRSLQPDGSLVDSFSRERQSARLYEVLSACAGSTHD